MSKHKNGDGKKGEREKRFLYFFIYEYRRSFGSLSMAVNNKKIIKFQYHENEWDAKNVRVDGESAKNAEGGER